MKKHIKLKIYGKVQGVGFRYYTQKTANELGIKGFVKNEYDGSVYIEASGKAEQIELFINRCWLGSKWAMVENIEIRENEFKSFLNFSMH